MIDLRPSLCYASLLSFGQCQQVDNADREYVKARRGERGGITVEKPPVATITAVSVPFRDTPDGCAAICYAADLGKRIGVPVRVIAHIPHAADVLRMLRDTSASVSADEHRRVERRVHELVGRSDVEVSIGTSSFVRHAFPSGTIVVDNELARQRRDIWALAPIEEASVARADNTAICIPLGDDESGRHALRYGLALAQRLQRQVLCYHTTWRKPDEPSAQPESHITGGTRANIEDAEHACVQLGIGRFRTIIETADGVVEGIVRAALREHCALIIVARGLHTGMGSYADQLLEESPIPVCIAPRPMPEVSR